MTHNMIVIYNAGTKENPKREMVHFKPKELIYLEVKDQEGWVIHGFDLKIKKYRNLYLNNIDAMADADKFLNSLAKIGLTIIDGEWNITNFELFKKVYIEPQVEALVFPERRPK